ncbi:rRNA processing/ribosome biogenesis-domain-containing protein [Boeremia exigua]|uniref:rRNA processing/ribosome biogenesis-domain-containing protein n=1 Tax=Boeremia exigua TaxID=749465 RepID=UPI001E8EB86A|nr:rRNA processing/ribosome biogenesis-domain-containing protein [Boeremia exigua]KAH6622190.1 rRNA processing/ribosome biogenesis-domain-containing protein [Boeremia exigua]
MAPSATELATLRALSFRISSTATAQLPQHVPAIAASLSNCRTILSSTQTSNAKTSSEASVAVHKYRTLLSTLLQDRTVQGRWSAIVLIKATIEVGGWETLQKGLPWVRGLLGILAKPDPPTSKKLCIITLTRIFMLTREYPTLIREITTPSLPTLVQSGLQIAGSNPSSSLLLTVLECFSELLPRHPTIFRSYLKTLRPLLCRLVAPTPSTGLSEDQSPTTVTTEVSDAARRLLIQLPCCAPKGASSEEWENALRTTIGGVHRVADRVFRAVLEDWQSTVREAPTNGHALDGEVQDLKDDYLSLPPWSGVFAGSERLVGLLQLVKEYLNSPTANQVTFRVGVIMDMITRMLSLTIPASGSKSFQNTVRINNQIGKEERENLWQVLPAIHVATIELLLAMADRLQASTLAIDTLVLDQLVWVFGSEKDNAQVRTACYLAIATVLERSGVNLPKPSIDSLIPLMRTCCGDLLPSEISPNVVKDTPGQAKSKGSSQAQGTANADSFLGSRTASDPIASYPGLKDAAYNLLPILLSDIRAQYFSDSLRARLDRTAVLVQHKDAMLASVLNPPPSKKFGKPAASILPLMARSFQGDRDIEGMLRPRLPVIRLGRQENDDDEEAEEDDEVEDEEDEPLEDTPADEGFVGQELDSMLKTAGETDVAVRDTTMRDAPPLIENTIVAAEESAQLEAPGKRPHTTDTPLSPAKRVRFGETEYAETSKMPPAANVAVTLVNDTASAEVPATSDFTVTSTASAIPDLPAPGEGGDDTDDDDDVVPLVFGQDTDDESE